VDFLHLFREVVADIGKEFIDHDLESGKSAFAVVAAVAAIGAVCRLSNLQITQNTFCV
jgi:hypothetical protein